MERLLCFRIAYNSNNFGWALGLATASGNVRNPWSVPAGSYEHHSTSQLHLICKEQRKHNRCYSASSTLDWSRQSQSSKEVCEVDISARHLLCNNYFDSDSDIQSRNSWSLLTWLNHSWRCNSNNNHIQLFKHSWKHVCELFGIRKGVMSPILSLTYHNWRTLPFLHPFGHILSICARVWDIRIMDRLLLRSALTSFLHRLVDTKIRLAK